MSRTIHSARRTLPPGVLAAGVAACSVVGLAATERFALAGVVVVLYLVLGGRYSRAPGVAVFITAGLLAVACTLAAQARGNLDWSLVFLAAAVIIALGGCRVHKIEGDEASAERASVVARAGGVSRG